jgi:hypothetical protein
MHKDIYPVAAQSLNIGYAIKRLNEYSLQGQYHEKIIAS